LWGELKGGAPGGRALPNSSTGLLPAPKIGHQVQQLVLGQGMVQTGRHE
jgi:hypothetical protein